MAHRARPGQRAGLLLYGRFCEPGVRVDKPKRPHYNLSSKLP